MTARAWGVLALAIIVWGVIAAFFVWWGLLVAAIGLFIMADVSAVYRGERTLLFTPRLPDNYTPSPKKEQGK